MICDGNALFVDWVLIVRCFIIRHILAFYIFCCFPKIFTARYASTCQRFSSSFVLWLYNWPFVFWLLRTPQLVNLYNVLAFSLIIILLFSKSIWKFAHFLRLHVLVMILWSLLKCSETWKTLRCIKTASSRKIQIYLIFEWFCDGIVNKTYSNIFKQGQLYV